MIETILDSDSRTRAAVLFARFADELTSRLLRRYSGVDPDAVADAVIDAILKVSADPTVANQSNQPLLHVLLQLARQRLRIRLRGDCRRRTREGFFADSVTNRHAAAPIVTDEIETRELAAILRTQIAQTAEEELVLDRWLNGFTNAEELAIQIGQTEAEVVTILARFRQRIKRERDRLAESSEPTEGHP